MVYHLVRSSYWEDQLRRTHYVPEEFEREGFIHLCERAQLDGVINRYYWNTIGLVLLHIDELRLEHKLHYEPGPEGGFFPHLYGPLNKAAVVKTEVIG